MDEESDEDAQTISSDSSDTSDIEEISSKPGRAASKLKWSLSHFAPPRAARKGGKQASATAATSSKRKSRKDDKGKGKETSGRSSGHRLTPRSSFGEDTNNDVDMKAAATLTSLLLSRPALSYRARDQLQSKICRFGLTYKSIKLRRRMIMDLCSGFSFVSFTVSEPPQRIV